MDLEAAKVAWVGRRVLVTAASGSVGIWLCAVGYSTWCGGSWDVWCSDCGACQIAWCEGGA
ncbi:hypothetical protein PDIG_57130 [Penicillium digitatum PHI26]|uniref:Uncharacterized protein n=2 Tax=Penicillium digitatum TaxID=36651 RepID=K9FMI5_PEND2|nr:hypothetical protein PDIP_66670 [Penicillium digitatum Pd1]EKV08952.1 hypothetical protein PDIP_66670 [Penicillium digitatum Pd1]EKV10424.1 hypothetical protein PDIG_57130 [Penicillium digitatum PHI26]